MSHMPDVRPLRRCPDVLDIAEMCRATEISTKTGCRLLKNGVHMKRIQEWLGHGDFCTTANSYAHLDAGSKPTCTQAMEKGLRMSSEALIE